MTKRITAILMLLLISVSAFASDANDKMLERLRKDEQVLIDNIAAAEQAKKNNEANLYATRGAIAVLTKMNEEEKKPLLEKAGILKPSDKKKDAKKEEPKKEEAPKKK